MTEVKFYIAEWPTLDGLRYPEQIDGGKITWTTDRAKAMRFRLRDTSVLMAIPFHARLVPA